MLAPAPVNRRSSPDPPTTLSTTEEPRETLWAVPLGVYTALWPGEPWAAHCGIRKPTKPVSTPEKLRVSTPPGDVPTFLGSTRVSLPKPPEKW